MLCQRTSSRFDCEKECVSKCYVSTNEICCKIDHEGFKSDCLDVLFYKMPILTITAIVKRKKIANS